MSKIRARPTTKVEETPEFKTFWDEVWFPRRNSNDGRGSARDEFFRHVEQYHVDPMDIVDGAKWFIRNGGNSEFKLHAQTWLNRRAYEDGADMERAFQAKQAERETNVVQMVRAAPLPANHFLNTYKAKQGEKS